MIDNHCSYGELSGIMLLSRCGVRVRWSLEDIVRRDWSRASWPAVASEVAATPRGLHETLIFDPRNINVHRYGKKQTIAGTA